MSFTLPKADDTPSSNDQGDGTSPENPYNHQATFGAPSEFLPRLPPSTETPSLMNPGAGMNEGQSAPTTKPLVDAEGRTLNPRSCVTCRKRKVKCDKLHPCSNCNKAHIPCIFPSPGRAPRKSRKIGESRDKELLERLRRLEGVVKGLGVDMPDGLKDLGDDTNKTDESGQVSRARSGSADVGIESSNTSSGHPGSTRQNSEADFRGTKLRMVEESQPGRVENKFGRLVINDGKSRYVNNSFWANLSNEVEDLKGILNQSSDEEDNPTSSPGSSMQVPSAHHGFIFGFSSQNVDLLSLHPLPGQIAVYWNIFKDRVDPLAKVLHIPTLEPTVLQSAATLNNLPRGFECLLFTIYYCAVTSLNTQDCVSQLGEEKPVLLARYRFAIEQALARANFLTTEEIVVLQAFVLFLICLRRNNDARVIWTLTGLVVRIAQTIGIHRDGTHFGLKPFEVEMRRRLWWQVCILDTRASEDHGCDPTILEQSFDTKMPLNINDADITPDMKEFPPDRQGCTDMSFCLLRFEVANYFRRINYVPPGNPKSCGEYFSAVTLEEKEKWIAECHQKIEERYLKHCDMTVPLYWVTATVARLMMSKMWLMVYHPFQRQDGGATLSNETKDKLFITSLENMEYSLLLETEARTMKWGWLFRTYVQWHALAFMLSELCYRTTGDMVERAWAAVEKTRDGRWGIVITEDTNSGHLWRPLRKLYRKAKEARQRGLQEEQRMAGQNRVVRTYSPNANPMFGHPARPRMTRAPLSQAQLQRFTDGPLFGQAPLDKHELLRSPKLTEAQGDDPMDTTGLGSSDLLQQPQQQIPQPQLDQNQLLQLQAQARAQGLSNNLGLPYDSTSGNPLAAPQARLAQPGNMQAFNQNFLAGAQNLEFAMDESGDLSQSLSSAASAAADPTGLPAGGGGDTTRPAMENLRVNSMDSLDNDFSIMDNAGGVNWANWDQLVRQYGMDLDSGIGDGPGGQVGGLAGAGNGMNWNGPNWEMGTNGANLRMGMGMGGGDWF